MNYIDLLILLILILSASSGYRRGFILGTLELCSWLGSIVLAFIFYPWLAAFLQKYFPSLDVWTTPVSFIILLILFRILLNVISNNILRQIPKDWHRHIVNKLIGIFPGLVNGLIWSAILAVFLMFLPASGDFYKNVHESKFIDNLVAQMEWVEDKLSPVFSEAVSKGLPKLTGRVDESRSITLPYQLESDKVRKELESEMLKLINNERTQRNLRPLTADPEMAVVARKHSKDMFARGYFSHLTPEGYTPFDRMKKEGVRFIVAGENLALAPTLSVAHTGLMNSPGHRANILNPSFGRVGIGIIDGGIHGLMITQNFRN